MPPELVHARCCTSTDLADRMRRQWWLHTRRVHRVTLYSGHADSVIELVVVGSEILVGQWPVVTHSIESVHPEIGRQQAHPMTTIKNGTTPDAANHDWVKVTVAHR